MLLRLHGGYKDEAYLQAIILTTSGLNVADTPTCALANRTAIALNGFSWAQLSLSQGLCPYSLGTFERELRPALG